MKTGSVSTTSESPPGLAATARPTVEPLICGTSESQILQRSRVWPELVDDGYDHDDPCHQIEHEGDVVQHFLGGGFGFPAAAHAAADQRQESHDPEDRERDSEPKVVGIEGGARGRIHCV